MVFKAVVLRRLACVALMTLTGGCAISPYAPGRSAADVPARITTVKLEPVSTVHMLGFSEDNPEGSLDIEPSDTELEVGPVLTNAVSLQLEESGFVVTEDESKKYDVILRLYYAYLPPSLLTSRALDAHLYVHSRDGAMLFHFTERYVARNLLQMVLVGRDSVAASTGQVIAAKVANELFRGTKPK